MPALAQKLGSGRKPKTLLAHIADGTYREERHGPIPANLADAMKGPKSDPPKKMPKGLPKLGQWAWKYICEHAVGLTPGDAMQMEMACRIWAEWNRHAVALPKLNPFDLDDKTYEQVSRRTLEYSRRLDGLLSSFGMNPSARMKMFMAANTRIRSDETDAVDREHDTAAPVKNTDLDLYRPDGPVEELPDDN